MTAAEEARALDTHLDRFYEGLLIDLAERPDDEIVPFGPLLAKAFVGYAVPAKLLDTVLTVAELRKLLRTMRAVLAAEAAGPLQHTPTKEAHR